MNNERDFFRMNMRYLRKKMHLTQRELGERLGRSESCIGCWETGYRSPAVEDVIQVAKFFGVPIQDMLSKELYLGMNLNGSKIVNFLNDHPLTESEEIEVLTFMNYLIARRDSNANL